MFDQLALWLYADGDPLMFCARLIAYLFTVEVAAYFVALVSSIAKGASK